MAISRDSVWKLLWWARVLRYADGITQRMGLQKVAEAWAGIELGLVKDVLAGLSPEEAIERWDRLQSRSLIERGGSVRQALEIGEDFEVSKDLADLISRHLDDITGPVSRVLESLRQERARNRPLRFALARNDQLLLRHKLDLLTLRNDIPGRVRMEINALRAQLAPSLPLSNVIPNASRSERLGAPDDEGDDDFAHIPGLFDQGTEVQTLLFSKEHFTRDGAILWALNHKPFTAEKVDEKPNTWRIRQKPTEHFDPATYRTIEFRPGVKAVIAVPL